MGTIAATYLEHLNSIETIEEARPRFDDDEPLGGWRGHDRYKEKLRDIERQQQRLEHPRHTILAQAPEPDLEPTPGHVETPFTQGDVRAPFVGFNAPPTHTLYTTAPNIPSFNDFKHVPPVTRQYEQPIGPNRPLPLHHDPKYAKIPLWNPNRERAAQYGPPAYTGPKPTYSYTHLNMPGHLPTVGDVTSAAKFVGRGFGAVGQGVGWTAGKVWGGKYGVKAGGAGLVRATVTGPWNAAREAKRTRAALTGRLGTAPERIVKDIVNLKKEFPAYKRQIDKAAKDWERQTQDTDYGERQAYTLQKKLINKRYKEINKKLGKQQGRARAWDVITATPRLAWAAYSKSRDDAKMQARTFRDQAMAARSGQIEGHVRNIDKFRDRYVDQILHDIKKGEIPPDSALREEYESVNVYERFIHEGKARTFKELMRNKDKVRARHTLAMTRGLTKRYSSPPLKKRRKGQKRDPLVPVIRRQRVGRKTDLLMWKARKNRVLKKKMKDAAYAVREDFKDRIHPTVRQIGAAPVTLPYKAARGTLRATGLNEIPDIGRGIHADIKRHFIHNFLLR